MSTYFKISAMVVLITAAAAAGPLCTKDTYAAYPTSGFSYAQSAHETFSKFSRLSFSTGLGVPELTPDQILVTPATSGDEASLSFTYGTTASPSPIFLVDNSQEFAFDLTYEAVAAVGKVLTGIQQMATFSNLVPGDASFTKNAQATGGGPIFTSAVTDGGTNHLSANYSGPITAISGDNSDFLIQDAISLQAEAGAVSNAGFANNLFTGPGGTTNTPEPPVSLLISSGLVLIGSLTRRVTARRRLNA